MNYLLKIPGKIFYLSILKEILYLEKPVSRLKFSFFDSSVGLKIRGEIRDIYEKNEKCNSSPPSKSMFLKFHHKIFYWVSVPYNSWTLRTSITLNELRFPVERDTA